ncbi:MAG TPA: 6-pyruvoyl-tetrahydropterin synthase-related protein [Patescibacteria group bacterium]|nr:6-pyruvoyl-tetrahydropterin synthase-related protein [Patescibacteria group bacterium]
MNWIIIVSLCILPLLYFLVPGLPVTHDGPDHVARIANFYQSLSEGNLVPRWAANLNWGYGHPILMFLYPLPSYVASLFHAFGFSFVDATKLVFVVAYIASALMMYLWAAAAFNKRVGVIAAVLYAFAPYRFVDMAVRGAIGEHIAFVFPPLVLYLLFCLAHNRAALNKKVWYAIGVSLTVAALILSHNAISIMFMPIILLYIIYLYFFVTKKDNVFLFSSLVAFFCGFGLSAFFWIPAEFEGKYTLRDIVTAGGVSDRFVPWIKFIFSGWSYGTSDELSKSIGFTGWIGVLAAIWAVTRKQTKAFVWFVSAAVAVFVISLFIMTAQSAFIWDQITLLQKFQFPWRFLSVSVFSVSILGGIGIDAFCNHLKRYEMYVIAGFCILTVVLSYTMWKPKAYSVKPESYYSGIYNSTTDTGESSPIWSVRFMEHRPNDPIGVISGVATIKPISRTTTKHIYQVSVPTSARLVENTLYFPGWNVYVDGVKTDMQFQDPEYRGLITFHIASGDHTVSIIFTDTKLRKIANYMSISVLLSLTVIAGLGETIWRKKI